MSDNLFSAYSKILWDNMVYSVKFLQVSTALIYSTTTTVLCLDATVTPTIQLSC